MQREAELKKSKAKKEEVERELARLDEEGAREQRELAVSAVLYVVELRALCSDRPRRNKT